MKEENNLQSLLKNIIRDYQEEITEVEDSLPSIDDENLNSLNSFLDDVNNILEVDLDSSDYLLREVIEDKSTREDLINNLKIIQTLLRLNKEKHTTFKLSFEQLEYIDSFLRKVKMIIKKQEEIKEENNTSREKLINICNKYKELLNIITNPNNQIIITDIEIVQLLLKESNLDSEARRKIIINLLKINQSTYKKVLSSKTTTIKISDKELEKIFDKYGYDYYELSESNKEYLKEYSTYEDINETLKCWVNYNFPIINLKEEGDLITHIIIRINKEDLNNMALTSLNSNINSIELLEILSILLIDSKTDKELQLKIKNYFKNITYLEDNKYDIKDIYLKNKTILWLDNKLLKKNIGVLKDYKLLSNSESISEDLLSIIDIEKLEEEIDSFIEISKNTYNYLIQSPQIIRMIHDNNKLLEAIYYEEHNKELLGAFLEKDNELILRNNIENSDFVPYQPSFINKESFDKIIKEYEIRDYIYQPIEILIKFIDTDNPLLYNMDGILISRLKVERIYELLVEANLIIKESLLYAITYNKLLTESEFNVIEKLIS